MSFIYCCTVFVLLPETLCAVFTVVKETHECTLSLSQTHTASKQQ